VHGTWLLAQGFADDDALKAIEDEARGEIESGVQFALDAPYPDPSEVTEDVFAA
jgi:acetoin:2,6-dichlorophenolindophenol oxidoreductase subunit alpha